jgi:hypothetical protein
MQENERAVALGIMSGRLGNEYMSDPSGNIYPVVSRSVCMSFGDPNQYPVVTVEQRRHNTHLCYNEAGWSVDVDDVGDVDFSYQLPPDHAKEVVRTMVHRAVDELFS